MLITVIGYPSPIGGADTELYHTISVWRRYLNLKIRCINAHKPRDDARGWMDSLGVETIIQPDITEFEFTPDDIVVGFCNAAFLRAAPYMRECGARLVWSNCMTFSFNDEQEFVQTHGPFDIHHFQSEFARASLAAVLGSEIEPHCRVIRGAFDFAEFPFEFRKKAPDDKFHVGRLARPDKDKWSSGTYGIYKRINYPDIRAWFMGVNERVYEKIGAPPHWATCIGPNDIPVRDFMSRLHCLMPINGGARENWPRVGLEAMASGIPVVAQRQWGWKEMIEHGVTGFLGDSDEELAHWASCLAWDEQLREDVAHNARHRLETELANPEIIAEEWKNVFSSIAELETVQKRQEDNTALQTLQ